MFKWHLAWRSSQDESRWALFEAEALPHVDQLFRLAMCLERDRTEAEDLVQETFTEALQSFHRFQQGTNCRAWLITIMRHLQSKRCRARGRALLVGDGDVDLAGTIPFEPPTPQEVTDADMLRALDALPAGFQEVVLLADVEELTYREIAAALHVPIGTVMSRLSRARQMMRRQLTDGVESGRRYARAVGEDSSE
jgi:RNA polymerase sigma-70 factor (ECF subfamily)